MVDSLSDHYHEVKSNSIAINHYDQMSQHNFDVVSQYTNKSSYYNIKKLKQNIVHKNRTLKTKKIAFANLEEDFSEQNTRKKNKREQQFPLLKYHM